MVQSINLPIYIYIYKLISCTVLIVINLIIITVHEINIKISQVHFRLKNNICHGVLLCSKSYKYTFIHFHGYLNIKIFANYISIKISLINSKIKKESYLDVRFPLPFKRKVISRIFLYINVTTFMKVKQIT